MVLYPENVYFSNALLPDIIFLEVIWSNTKKVIYFNKKIKCFVKNYNIVTYFFSKMYVIVFFQY